MESSHTCFLPFHRLSLCALEHPPFSSYFAKRRIPSVVVLRHAVVLLSGAVVLQPLAVVQLEPMVVPLLWSRRTVALRPSAAASR